MPVYTYTAKNTEGKQKTGTVDARSEASAVTLLKEQGLFVVGLQERRAGFMEKVMNIRGIPDTEVVTFTRQFSTMISAGLPLSRALEVLADQTVNVSMRKVLLDCLRDVQGGASLSNAFSRYPHVFSPTYIALVRAGEASGKLDEILKRLADNLEASRELRSKFKGAMIYPIIVLIAMIGVLVLMLVFVIPKLSQMYESLDAELPTITKVMIGVSDFFVSKWYLFVVLLVGGFFAAKSFLATDQGKELVARIFFNAPIFGKINKSKDITEFTRTLSLLLKSGISIVEALNIVSKVVTNPKYKEAALSAATAIEKGNSLSEYMKADRSFPPLISQMASVGEETGQLDEVLGRVADFFASETDHAVKGLSAALEPVILILLGGMVGVLIVSIIVPIYKITSSI